VTAVPCSRHSMLRALSVQESNTLNTVGVLPTSFFKEILGHL